jgi:putative ABC transport system permease protein
MRQLYHAFKAVINAGRGNLIKITSLSLGLLVGTVLLALVAREAGYDNFYRAAGDLYLIHNRYTIGGKAAGESHIVMAPMAPALAGALPEVACATTVFANKPGEPFLAGERRFELKPLLADSLFFRTLGLKVLSGDPRLLGIADNLFISDEAARRVFGDEDPVGKTLLHAGDHPYTVQGIFRHVPDNNSLRGDVVISLANAGTRFGLGTGWDGGDSYWGIVRLVKGASPARVNEEINKVWRAHFDLDALAAAGFVIHSYIAPFKDLRGNDARVTGMMLLLSVLAVIILLVAALNYVLVSLSALSRRAAGIAIHKCAGASSRDIFAMFMYETAILVVVSLAVAVVLLLLARSLVEALAGVPLAALFTPGSLWVPAGVLLFLFGVGGALPARVFSAIPVTRVFRAFTGHRRRWKQALLFAQFLGITFIALLLIITARQYGVLIHQDLGYRPGNVVHVKLRDTGVDPLLARQEMERLPFVEIAATSASLPFGYSGTPLADDAGNLLFSARHERADARYLPAMGMTFVAGGNFTGPGQVVVTEALVKRAGWTGNPLGRVVTGGPGHAYGKVVGVIADYISSAGMAREPVLIQGREILDGYLTLRLPAITPDNLAAIRERLDALHPAAALEPVILQEVIRRQHAPTRRFRDIAAVACACIFLVTLVGLLGYVHDEVRRREREIAIRKINGATRAAVLRLVTGHVVAIALPAILLALPAAYLAGERLLGLFAWQAPLHAALFVAGGGAVLAVVVASVASGSWRAAGENPARTIKRGA